MMLLSMSWISRRDGKYLFDMDLLGVVIRGCLEQGATVDTAVLSDCGVAEYAAYIAQGCQSLEQGWVARHHQLS